MNRTRNLRHAAVSPAVEFAVCLPLLVLVLIFGSIEARDDFSQTDIERGPAYEATRSAFATAAQQRATVRAMQDFCRTAASSIQFQFPENRSLPTAGPM